MPHPKTFPSSSIGPAPGLGKNFFDRPEVVSITWDDSFNFKDDSWFKVYHQCEPPEVMEVVDKLIANHKFYDLILAWDERILRQCTNAVFLTESACSWFDRKSGKLSPAPLGQMRVEGYALPQANPVVVHYESCDVGKKAFSASFLTSSKNMFPGHVLRQEIYEKLPEVLRDLRVWKHKSPPRIEDKRTVLEPFQYSIVPENSRHSGYYSEKIVDCFIAKTIPIYWGCTDIDKHFNTDGIIVFKNYEDLLVKLKELTPETYSKMLPAIEENHKLALKGVYQWDLIEQAIDVGIANKYKNGTQTSAPTTQTQAQNNVPHRPLRIQCTDR